MLSKMLSQQVKSSVRTPGILSMATGICNISPEEGETGGFPGNCWPPKPKVVGESSYLEKIRWTSD